MRAYMSDRVARQVPRFVSHVRCLGPVGTERYSLDHCTQCESVDAADAVNEARAILAVTEDDNGHSDPVAWPRVRDERPFPVGPVGTYGWERYGYDSAFWSANSRGALAEALAAFIEA